MLNSGKPYTTYHPQNGSVPQAFFGTSQLFPETEQFNFKFGASNVSHMQPASPFTFNNKQLHQLLDIIVTATTVIVIPVTVLDEGMV